MLPPKRLLVVTLLLFFASHVSAQNINDTLGICPPRIQEIANGRARFNATGTADVKFPNQEDWYLSLTFRDFRGGEMIGTSQYLSILLGVPKSLVGTDEGNSTRICVYRMDGQNGKPDIDGGDANSTCTGIIGDKCQEALHGISSPGNTECAPVEDVSDACGLPVILQQVAPLNFSSPLCSVHEIPGINIPTGYATYQAGGGTMYPPDDRNSFELYDLRVQQPIPILFKAAFPGSDGISSSYLVCLAPDQIAEGSRLPEAELPDEDPNNSSGLSVPFLRMVGLLMITLAFIS